MKTPPSPIFKFSAVSSVGTKCSCDLEVEIVDFPTEVRACAGGHAAAEASTLDEGDVAAGFGQFLGYGPPPTTRICVDMSAASVFARGSRVGNQEGRLRSV